MADDPSPPLEETPPAGLDRAAMFPPAHEAAQQAQLRQLHPALRKVWIIAGLLTAGFVVLIVGVVEHFWWVGQESWPLPDYALTVGVLVVFVVKAFVTAFWRYQSWRYAIRPHDVLLHYGMLWRTRSCIPRLRIQHVDIESGPIDRAFGMVKLSLYTAGTASAVGTIPGLLPEDAEALRETLLATERADG